MDDFFNAEEPNKEEPQNPAENNDIPNFQINQDDDFGFVNPESNENDNTNQNQNDFFNKENNNTNTNQNTNYIPFDNNLNNANIEIDEEEQKRIEQREIEKAEKRKKIEEKINKELKEKEERRLKAVEFMNNFESKRNNAIDLRKKANLQNEEEYQNNKKLIKEENSNPWEIVVDNIYIKDSEYKGSKDVSRMKASILARKNDLLKK